MSDAARELLARALERPVASVADDAAIGRQDGWDSLAHVRLALAVEERMGRKLEPDEVLALRTLAGVRDLLTA